MHLMLGIFRLCANFVDILNFEDHLHSITNSMWWSCFYWNYEFVWKSRWEKRKNSGLAEEKNNGILCEKRLMSLFHLTSISNLLKIVMEIEEKWNRLILLALNAYQFEQRIFLKRCHLMALLMTRLALKTIWNR